MKNPFSCLFLDDDVGLEEPMEEPMEEVEFDPFFPSRGALTPTPTHDPPRRGVDVHMPWTEEK